MNDKDLPTAKSADEARSQAPATGNPIFDLHGIRLEIPPNLLTPRIEQAISTGKYEHLEARQLPRFLCDGDLLLEFGAGLGFISALCAKTVKLSSCTVVEANPELIPVIKRNHHINHVASTVINAASLSQGSSFWNETNTQGKIPFYIAENFWGSSLAKSKNAKKIEYIDAIITRDLINRILPTVIICDIEGGEIDIFEECNLSSVNHMFFEVHKSIIGLSGINKVTQTLARENLFYDPDFSVGATMMFSKG